MHASVGLCYDRPSKFSTTRGIECMYSGLDIPLFATMSSGGWSYPSLVTTYIYYHRLISLRSPYRTSESAGRIDKWLPAWNASQSHYVKRETFSNRCSVDPSQPITEALQHETRKMIGFFRQGTLWVRSNHRRTGIRQDKSR